jgi:hypothetical protein
VHLLPSLWSVVGKQWEGSLGARASGLPMSPPIAVDHPPTHVPVGLYTQGNRWRVASCLTAALSQGHQEVELSCATMKDTTAVMRHRSDDALVVGFYKRD